MLEPTSTSIASSSVPQKRAFPLEEESLTEDYGEQPRDVRTSTGGVDFFTSLGTERQKKPKVDPTEVSPMLSNQAPFIIEQ